LFVLGDLLVRRKKLGSRCEADSEASRDRREPEPRMRRRPFRVGRLRPLLGHPVAEKLEGSVPRTFLVVLAPFVIRRGHAAAR
jgi:hypothetical protein